MNAIQDMKADQVNLGQDVSVGSIKVGEVGLQILRFGAGELQFSGHARTTGILRAGAGLELPKYTTTQRNAIAAGQRPQGLTIFNTSAARIQVNAGSDATPTWQEFTPSGQISDSDISGAAAIAKSKLAALNIVDADISAGAAIAKSKLASLNIVNADINASAAIAVSKLAPGTNGQFLTVTGGVVVWGAGGGGGGPSPGGVDTAGIGDAAADGSAATYARSDHRHRVRYLSDAGNVVLMGNSDGAGGGGIYFLDGTASPAAVGTANEKMRLEAGKLSIATTAANHLVNLRVFDNGGANQVDGIEIKTTGREYATRHFLRSDSGARVYGALDWLSPGGSAFSVIMADADPPPPQSSMVGAVAIGSGQGGGGSPGKPNYRLDVGGYVGALEFVDYSDEAMKVGIAKVPKKGVLDRVKKVAPIKYRYSAEISKRMQLKADHEHIGFSAQEIHEHFPEASIGIEGEGLAGIQLGKMIAVLWQAVQELTEEVEALKA